MTDKATAKVDPLAHVNMILDAESPAPRPEISIPMVTEQSQKLSDMMDDLTDLKDFDDLKARAEKQMAQTASIDPVKDPVKLPPPRAFDSPRQATPRAPKPVSIPEYEAEAPGRRRRRTAASNPTPVTLPTASPSTTEALNGDHIARLLGLVHMAGSTILGPEFAISQESAKEIGDAAMPVLEDFGVHAASRAIHLLMFVSTVAFIEGPIAFTAINAMRARANMRDTGMFSYNVGGPAPTNVGPMGSRFPDGDVAAAISQATGVQIGNAPE